MPSSLSDYRARVTAKHARAFQLHHRVGSLVEATLYRARIRSTPTDLVMDMLLIQCIKAHASVSLLAQHGLMEDTATLARRLLELSVQAVYVGAEDDSTGQDRKAGKYIAFMWRQIGLRHRRRLPEAVRNEWSAYARRYGRFIRKGAKSWGPNWRDMFKECGIEPLYLQDYTFLSGIAHGRSAHQVFQFSEGVVRVHSDDFASVTLVYASRYLLAAADAWNRVHNEFDEGAFAHLAAQASTFDFDAAAA